MNCDQVFDILTRGPFPTGAACDSQVESHLDRCAECRRLAEALRPALELFQESITPEESRDLPGYWRETAAERKRPVVSYAEEAEPRRAAINIQPPSTQARGWTSLGTWSLAAALALGVTLGSLMNAQSPFAGFSSWPPNRGAAAVGAPAPDDELQFKRRSTNAERQFLASLPAACYDFQPMLAKRNTEPLRQILANADLGNLKCCTDCHKYHAEVAPKSATVTIAERCKFCHKEE